MLTYKHRLPWIHNKLRKMINKKNKLYFKMKKDKKYKEKYKHLKHQVQKEQRHVYNTYIEKLILDLPFMCDVFINWFVRLFLNKFHISFTVIFASIIGLVKFPHLKSPLLVEVFFDLFLNIKLWNLTRSSVTTYYCFFIITKRNSITIVQIINENYVKKGIEK
jgi:hypothetical protein